MAGTINPNGTLDPWYTNDIFLNGRLTAIITLRFNLGDTQRVPRNDTEASDGG